MKSSAPPPRPRLFSRFSILLSFVVTILLYGVQSVISARSLAVVLTLVAIVSAGLLTNIVFLPQSPRAPHPAFVQQSTQVTKQEYAQILVAWEQLNTLQPRSAVINRQLLSLLSTSPSPNASLAATITNTTHLLSP